MQPTCIMMQRAHKAKQTIAEKGNGSRRQEVKDRGGGGGGGRGGGHSLGMGGENGRVGRNRRGKRVREWIKRRRQRCCKDNSGDKEP